MSVQILIFFRRKLFIRKVPPSGIINSSVPETNIYAKSHNGSNHVTASHVKSRVRIYEIMTMNGKKLECAGHHEVVVSTGHLKEVNKLQRGDSVMTDRGISKVKRIRYVNRKEMVFDFTVAAKDHLYFTNGILSSNSIVTAIFIAWYILFHYDRNVMVTSKNDYKVKDLMQKMETIIDNLPYFMKPQFEIDNVKTKMFANGCKIHAQTTKEDTGASFDVHLLYCDEFALVKSDYLRAFYRVILPTISSSDVSKMIITSTPRGANKFYEIYSGAVHSKNLFNPIRVDWYEVPLTTKELLDRGYTEKEVEEMREKGEVPKRDEKWKNDMIKGQEFSEEDFNQEYGNQFLAGSKLLFKSDVSRFLKSLQIKFKPREIQIFEDLYDNSDIEIDYKDHLVWHPRFNMDNLMNDACRFVVSVDLADGGGGNYSVINIFQILPMSSKEIDELKIFTEEQDFFKMVQVGMFRSNETPLTELAFIFYHIVTDVIKHPNVKTVLEMNHEGNYFRNLVNNLYGERNRIEADHLYARFKYNMGDEASQAYRIGLNRTSKVKRTSIKIVKDKVKYNQLIPLEYMTIEEGLSFAKNKKGKYVSQTGHDDCIDTVLNLIPYFDNMAYLEQIDELLSYCPQGFLDKVRKKLSEQDEPYPEDQRGIEDIIV